MDAATRGVVVERLTRSILGLVILTLLGCASGGTERTRNPRTGIETVRMKGNALETPGEYGLAFNVAVVSDGRQDGYAAYVIYRGPEEIQVPFSNAVDVHVGDQAWTLRGMVDRERSGVVGGNMGVSRSYVIYVVITLQESQVRELLSSDRFTVIVNGLRGRYRGTGGSETIHRIRAFLNGGT